VRQPGPSVPSASTLGPAARQAIDLADMLEQMGASPVTSAPGMTEGALATMGASSAFAPPAGSIGTFIGRS
jgi:hypothetical protein